MTIFPHPPGQTLRGWDGTETAGAVGALKGRRHLFRLQGDDGVLLQLFGRELTLGRVLEQDAVWDSKRPRPASQVGQGPGRGSTEVGHVARDRTVCAGGALHAAAWLRCRSGVWTMDDVSELEGR